MALIDISSPLKSDGNEYIRYDNPDFPAFLRENKVEKGFVFTLARSHWHDEVEFIIVLSGSVRYNINGETVRIGEGEGLFVNARQFHCIVSDDGNAAHFYCIILHPIMLCSSRFIEREFVNPVISDSKIPYVILKSSVPWQARILEGASQIYRCREEKAGELKIQMYFCDIWSQLYSNLGVCSPSGCAMQSHQLTALKEMIAFIHEHYSEPLKLSDICTAAGVGKTAGTAIFKKCIDRTPISFLTEYRLEKASEMLQKTDMTISEICYAAGFAGASYFTETFKKHFGTTPKEYRNGARLNA